MNYKVKNFRRSLAEDLQDDIKTWVETGKHVVIYAMNTWYDTDESKNFCTIIYAEKEYNL